MACLLSEPSTWGKTKGGMFWVAGVWLQVLSWAAMTAGVGPGRLGLLALGSVRRHGGAGFTIVALLTNRQRARGNWRWSMVATMGMTGVAAAAWAWLVVVSSGAILVPDHPVNAPSLLPATVAVNTNTPAFVLAQRDLAHQQLHRLVSVDGLTGLLNRHAFMVTGSMQPDLMRRHLQLACLVMIEIDHFKRINDSFGHDEGDRERACGVRPGVAAGGAHARTRGPLWRRGVLRADADIRARLGGQRRPAYTRRDSRISSLARRRSDLQRRCPRDAPDRHAR